MSRYIVGLDPASKDDVFGVVIHELTAGSTMPKLRVINKLMDTTLDKMYQYLVQYLFQKYPPRYIVIDYSNEKTFSDLLVRLYGKDKVELVSFSTDSKLMLKEDDLSILRQECKFPNPKSATTDPGVREHVQELINQLKSEQMLATKTGKTTFDHLPAHHNDLAIAWELSIHGCLRFMTRPGYVPAIVSASMERQGWQEYERSQMSQDQRNLEDIKAGVRKRLSGLGPGVEITGLEKTDW